MKTIALDIKPLLNASEDSESLAVFVSGVPEGASLSAGSCCFDGCWELRREELDGLCITPPSCSDADMHLTVRAISTEVFNGSSVEGVQTFQMRVAVPQRDSLDFTSPGLRWVQGGLQQVPSY
jgi:hypothetical protein